MSAQHFQIAFQPLANSAAIITAPHVRFTVLAAQLKEFGADVKDAHSEVLRSVIKSKRCRRNG
jgi:hypothetical protein